MLIKTIILSSCVILTSLSINTPDVDDTKTCEQMVITKAAHTVTPTSETIVTAVFYHGEIIPTVMLSEVVITPEKEAGTLVHATRVGDKFVPTVMLDEVVIRPM